MELVVVICLGFGWAKSYLCIYSNIFQGKLKSFPLGRDRFLQPKKWWKYSAFEAIVKNVLMCLSWKFLWVAKWNDHFLPGKKKMCLSCWKRFENRACLNTMQNIFKFSPLAWKYWVFFFKSMFQPPMWEFLWIENV